MRVMEYVMGPEIPSPPPLTPSRPGPPSLMGTDARPPPFLPSWISTVILRPLLGVWRTFFFPYFWFLQSSFSGRFSALFSSLATPPNAFVFSFFLGFFFHSTWAACFFFSFEPSGSIPMPTDRSLAGRWPAGSLLKMVLLVMSL